MDAALLGHLVLEQAVHQPVAGRLHLGPEGLRGDDEPEVRLARSAAGHGLVVRVEVRVVVNLERRRGEGGCDLFYEKEGRSLVFGLGSGGWVALIGRMYLFPDRVLHGGLGCHCGKRPAQAAAATSANGSSCEAEGSTTEH